jgi:hypothetical protein
MSESNLNEELIAKFRESLKKIKHDHNRLMERLREIETEENRLRQEMKTLEESSLKITEAIHSILAITESNKENPRTSYDDSLLDDFDDYDNFGDGRRDEQYNRNNRNNRNNRSNRNQRDNRGNDYINSSNRRNQNYSQNDYSNDSVAYINPKRNVPHIAQNIEPLNQRFADRTITQACTLLLREINTPLHVNELYNFLVAGGFEFKGNNPTISIAVSLNRNRRFKKVAPGTFDLVMRDASQAAS